MSANTEAVRRGSVPSFTWIGVAVALILAAAIVVVSLSGNGTTTSTPRGPAVTVEQTTAGSPDSVAEMAALKAGTFAQGPDLHDGVSIEPTHTSEAIDIAGLKAGLIERIIRGR